MDSGSWMTSLHYEKLENEPKEIGIEILDASGKVLRNYSKAEMALNFGKDGGVNSGLNKFVWDMRINKLSSVPKRPGTAVIPIVTPGKYTVKLTVDGTEESQDFEIFMSPKENYSQTQSDAKFAFWMDMYNTAENSIQNVISALKVRDDAKAKLETFKTSGAKSRSISKAEKQYASIEAIVNTYEGTYVSTGRTLAEVINLPATILFKMSFMSGILDHSEGPVSQSMKTEFEQLKVEDKAATEQYEKDIAKTLEKFEKMLQ